LRAIAKAVFIGVGLILIAVAVGLILLSTQADKLARLQLEKILSHALKTTVTVDSAEVALLAQTLKVQGLTVANPAGFESENPAMRFNRVQIQFHAGSLLSDTPVIEQILLDGVDVNLQFDTKEGTNLGVLMHEAERTSLERRSEQPRSLRRQYEIRSLRCENARIEFETSLVPTSGLGLDISPFTLEDISREHPVTASQISAIFLKSLLTEALTFKGLLRPVGEFLRRELNELMAE
jgi:uncharacterized protein involved in outer membrane biogenesis